MRRRLPSALKQGASFAGYARQYSEASTAAVGGDLGWIRPEQLPDAIAGTMRQMNNNSLSGPIEIPGGFSIVALIDKRKVLTADPRAAVLNLKQVSIRFPAGTRRPGDRPVRRFTAAAQNVGGCGGAEKLRRRLQGRGRPVRTSQDERASGRVAGHDAADAGRPGDPPVRLDPRGRPRARDVRPRRGE